ncbi:hypothetical protein J5N97_024678 [Dioscorea zingiberensis]|uniref:Uncharacterized protein n=1 Tax=Dioscorea zingiberensis TaxID=325984 RepID=A0A9D5C758_9LILI|nr:hypothetical protein J5N97_024678 [Dioscorea zingiberensis]
MPPPPVGPRHRHRSRLLTALRRLARSAPLAQRLNAGQLTRLARQLTPASASKLPPGLPSSAKYKKQIAYPLASFGLLPSSSSGKR